MFVEANGNKYLGEWDADTNTYHGHGTLHRPDGTSETMLWEYGEPHDFFTVRNP